MVTLTNREAVVLGELRANLESCREESGGEVWVSVYLPNCPSSREKGFNGVLSSLSKKGLYRPEGDDIFGDVKVE